jgi:hypothetical protein
MWNIVWRCPTCAEAEDKNLEKEHKEHDQVDDLFDRLRDIAQQHRDEHGGLPHAKYMSMLRQRLAYYLDGGDPGDIR